MTSQNDSDVAARADEYAARVAAALSDLPADETAALLDGLAGHLLERGDDGVPLLDQQGSPEQYAAELRVTVTGRTAAPSRPTRRSRPSWVVALGVILVLVAAAAVMAPRLRGTDATPTPAPTTTATATSTATAVPDLVGLSRTEAETAIQMAGFRLGTVTVTTAASAPAGSVVAMTPAAGTQAPADSAIDLTVAK